MYRIKTLLSLSLEVFFTPLVILGGIFAVILFAGQLDTFGQYIAFHPAEMARFFYKLFWIVLSLAVITGVAVYWYIRAKERDIFSTVTFGFVLWVFAIIAIIAPSHPYRGKLVMPPKAPPAWHYVTHNRVMLRIVGKDNKVTSITGKASISSLGHGRYLVQLNK